MANAFRQGIVALLDEAGGNELQGLIADIGAAGNIGANIPLIDAIQPAILAKGRAAAVGSAMTYREAKAIFEIHGHDDMSQYAALERLYSPEDPAFDNIVTIPGIDAFQVALARHGDAAQIANSRKIMDQCMSHYQTFIYPLRFTTYTSIPTVRGGAPNVLPITYGPATSSKPDPATAVGVAKYTATPVATNTFGSTDVDNMDMWQFPPNCLYQSQIKILDGYSESRTVTMGFPTGTNRFDNCVIKTFLKGNNRTPIIHYPFDSSNLKMPSGWNILIRRSDSAALFIDQNGNLVKQLPSSIIMKLPTTHRIENNQLNNGIANYVGSMMQTPMTVVNITNTGNRVNVSAAVFPARMFGAGALPANVWISDHDIRAQPLNQIYDLNGDNLMALRMCARIALWRYRAIKPQSTGGSNKMMITNMSNKTRNMNKRQRRSKSKSKSKSMSMFKSAKRAFYKTNKRNKTSRRY